MAVITTTTAGNIRVSTINNFRGAPNSNTSLKGAELGALGDPSGTGAANPAAAGALCMPNELYDDVSLTLRSLTASPQPGLGGNLWVYAPSNGNTRPWGMARMSEFATAYTGVPTIQARSVRVWNISVSVGYMVVTVGGEYSDGMSVYTRVDGGVIGTSYGTVPNGTPLVPGVWTTLGTNPCYLYGANAGSTVTFFVKDKYGCGNNYSRSATIPYP